MTLARTILALWFAALSASAQLPPSGSLSDSDLPLFRAEIARLEKLLPSAPDRATMMYEIARTWASAKQWPEAINWLRRVADRKAGLDPSRDSIFTDLRGAKEFEAILAGVRSATPRVSHGNRAFEIKEGDLVPESVAYDPKGKLFYFGSMRKGKIVKCSTSGECLPFAGGLGEVLGLKVNGEALWVLNNSDNESALIRYALASGRMLQRYSVAGKGHTFNDLAFAPSGDVYLTDTQAGLVWILAKGTTALARLPGKFAHANGIAVSSDGRLLYVSTYPDGIVVVDLKANTVKPIPRPNDLCLAAIDGLYFHRGTLIAIQNAFMTPRVVRLYVTADLARIERFEVLERRNPLFDGVTTGVVVGDDFYFMANIQDEKKTGFDPIKILKIGL